MSASPTDKAAAAATIVPLIRNSGYKLLKTLGQGACGTTVLLEDPHLPLKFVAKRYTPYAESERQSLFENFKREIELLYRLHHPNVVRVFNHYLYPVQHSGIILMEHIDGLEISDYVKAEPASIADLFRQAVDGFTYLESRGVLHRDIREANLMVTAEGVLKIIDLGFGKAIESQSDFNKSISLNWWCEKPYDFTDSTYDFCTEAYFVGMLFEKLLSDAGTDTFEYSETLDSMKQRSRHGRIKSFAEAKQRIQAATMSDSAFSDEDKAAYRAFSSAARKHIASIEGGCKYNMDTSAVVKKIRQAYQAVMLEEEIPNCQDVMTALLNGQFRFFPQGFPVRALKDFVELAGRCDDHKRRVLLSNLYNALDTVQRTEPQPPPTDDSDIPF
ncbi:MAG: protein kinase [Planctomycetota bacterium]